MKGWNNATLSNVRGAGYMCPRDGGRRCGWDDGEGYNEIGVGTKVVLTWDELDYLTKLDRGRHGVWKCLRFPLCVGCVCCCRGELREDVGVEEASSGDDDNANFLLLMFVYDHNMLV